MATKKKSASSSTRTKKQSYSSVIKELSGFANTAVANDDGENVVSFLTEFGKGRWDRDKVFSTGSIQLDVATGVGGLPRGIIVEMAGFEYAGKSTVCLRTAALAQENEVPVIYIDTEYALNPDYMTILGVNLDLLPIARPTSLETCIDFMLEVMDSDIVKERGCLMILDSVAATKSNIVRNSSAEEHLRRGAEAARWAERIGVIGERANKTKSTIVMINQLREAQDQYSKPQGPGGSALRFGYSMQIHMRRGKVEKDKNGEPDYMRSNFKINKNRYGKPYLDGFFVNVPDKGINHAHEIMEALKEGYVSENVYKDYKWDSKLEEFVASSDNWSFNLDDTALSCLLQDDPEHDSNDTCFSVRYKKAFLEFLDAHPSLAAYIADEMVTTNLAPEEAFIEEEGEFAEEADSEEAESDDAEVDGAASEEEVTEESE